MRLINSLKDYNIPVTVLATNCGSLDGVDTAFAVHVVMIPSPASLAISVTSLGDLFLWFAMLRLLVSPRCILSES